MALYHAKFFPFITVVYVLMSYLWVKLPFNSMLSNWIWNNTIFTPDAKVCKEFKWGRAFEGALTINGIATWGGGTTLLILFITLFFWASLYRKFMDSLMCFNCKWSRPKDPEYQYEDFKLKFSNDYGRRNPITRIREELKLWDDKLIRENNTIKIDKFRRIRDMIRWNEKPRFEVLLTPEDIDVGAWTESRSSDVSIKTMN